MALEALIRSLPERSMRMQVRFEITRVPEGPAGLARQAADLLRHGVGCPGQPRVPGGRGVQCPGLSNGLSDFGISRPSGSEVRPIRIVSRPPQPLVCEVQGPAGPGDVVPRAVRRPRLLLSTPPSGGRTGTGAAYQRRRHHIRRAEVRGTHGRSEEASA
jgi:hypothetical protein